MREEIMKEVIQQKVQEKATEFALKRFKTLRLFMSEEQVMSILPLVEEAFIEGFNFNR